MRGPNPHTMTLPPLDLGGLSLIEKLGLADALAEMQRDAATGSALDAWLEMAFVQTDAAIRAAPLPEVADVLHGAVLALPNTSDFPARRWRLRLLTLQGAYRNA